jgi:hypothetical protein
MTNRSAFPFTFGEGDAIQNGMTLREYLAAKFLAAMIVARGEGVADPSAMVSNAYHFADLMLED